MPEQTRVPTTSAKEGWSNETLLDHVLALITEADKRYQQRFEASEKALDLGFTGQKSAVDAAFAAQKDAINAAFAAQKDAINAALASADRAVTKAELATEKRFESVNEFRGTLDQQQRTLIPRSEVAAIVEGLNEKIGGSTRQLDEKVNNLTKQIDEMKSRTREQASEAQGVKGGWGLAVGLAGFVFVLLGIVAWVAAFIARQG